MDGIQTPYYYIDESKLINNLEVLAGITARSGAKILLAQKAFSMFSLYGLISRYLGGTCSSGLFEAKLARTYMKLENHIFSPAYIDREFDEIASICDHIVFNSFDQWTRFRDRALGAGASCGIRINPGKSTQKHAIYDPCAPGSRLGVTADKFRPDLLDGISGLHFHTLCEQQIDALIPTLEAVEAGFGKWLKMMRWVNFGGGHHLTRGYDIDALAEIIVSFSERYGVQVYLEPGEAVVLDTGYLVSSVLDFVNNDVTTAILDTSAACHMPDVLEMPYRPEAYHHSADGGKAGLPGEKPFLYRLAGPTCLAGDIIGDYSFDEHLHAGDLVIFGDMAHYTMVKNNTFNGMNLPSIAVLGADSRMRTVRRFGFDDFMGRLS